ncbi:polysaccharide pyruvyl transferase family protein [Streptomyces sp. NPDC079189]|uniref:polysaccharide pyruvyl transferase family protein n=1 Tax=Streptomyces sp. NPDC079189 TaxID=3154514 RepID=UPI00343CF819
MAIDPHIALITEAYSGHNLGDRELVLATVDVVHEAHPSMRPVVVALEPETFRDALPHVDVLPRLFDRRRLAEVTAVQRACLLAAWGAFALAETVFVALRIPARLRRSVARWLLGAPAMRTYDSYCRTGKHYAVGGGYLGDRYVKESALTLWTWWWAVRRGVSVATMPVSIEAQGPTMKRLLRGLLPGVQVAVRDESSESVLHGLGLRCRRFPDLAFRNAFRIAELHPAVGDRCIVFPVGSDYFDEAVWRERWSDVCQVAEAEGLSLLTYAMHEPIRGALAGHDLEVVDLLVEQHGAERLAGVASYQDLCTVIGREARLVITARMHAAIAALSVGVPAVVLGYEEKHRTLMQLLGLENLYISLDQASQPAIAEAISIALSLDRMDLTRRVHAYAHPLDGLVATL